MVTVSLAVHASIQYLHSYLHLGNMEQLFVEIKPLIVRFWCLMISHLFSGLVHINAHLILVMILEEFRCTCDYHINCYYRSLKFPIRKSKCTLIQDTMDDFTKWPYGFQSILHLFTRTEYYLEEQYGANINLCILFLFFKIIQVLKSAFSQMLSCSYLKNCLIVEMLVQ